MAHPLEAVTAAVLLLCATAVASGYVNLPYAALSSPFAIAILVIASLGAFAVSPAVGLSAFLLTAVLLFKRNVQKTFSNVSTYGESSIMKQKMGNANPYATASSGPRPYPEFQETNPMNPLLGPTIEQYANYKMRKSSGPRLKKSGGTRMKKSSGPRIESFAASGTKKSNFPLIENFAAQKMRKPSAPRMKKSSGPRIETFASKMRRTKSRKIENFAVQEPAPYGDEQGSPVYGQFPKEAARASSTPQAVEYNYRPDESIGDNTFTRFGPDLDEKKKVFAY